MVLCSCFRYSCVHFPLQVVECRLGALLLAKHLNLPYKVTTRPFPSYKVLLDSYFKTPPPAPGPVAKGSRPPTHLPPTLPTRPALPSSRLPPNQETKSHELRIFIGLVLQALGGPGMENGMTWEEVAERLECDPTELQLQVADREVEPQDGKFKILNRARHVVSWVSLSSTLLTRAKWDHRNLSTVLGSFTSIRIQETLGRYRRYRFPSPNSLRRRIPRPHNHCRSSFLSRRPFEPSRRSRINRRPPNDPYRRLHYFWNRPPRRRYEETISTDRREDGRIDG